MKKSVAVKPAEKIDRLFENFASELVTIVIDKDVEFSKQSEDSIETTKTPLSAIGYLTDIDDDYIYLGHEPNLIHQAIRKDYVVHIEVSDIEEDTGPAMDVGPVPKNSKGYN